MIKLASNENAFGPSPRAAEAIQASLPKVHRYPDGNCLTLRLAIADYERLDAERIVCGGGSDDIITLLTRAFAGPGDTVLYTQHGFLIYPISAQSVGAQPIAVPETDLTADVDALLAALDERTRIVFIANPNNPTGSYLPASEMARLADGLPADVLLVVDAAYAEYVGRSDYADGRELVDRGNVVVTRTFSKIYGLGGVRLGWGYCPPAIADVLNRLRNPFNVSSLAQVAGLAALSDRAFVERSRSHNTQWRDWLSDELRTIGLQVLPSVANFILVRFPTEAGKDAAAADAFLKQHGIIVRRVVAYGLPDCLRITIGLAEEMHAVATTLRAFVGN